MVVVDELLRARADFEQGEWAAALKVWSGVDHTSPWCSGPAASPRSLPAGPLGQDGCWSSWTGDVAGAGYVAFLRMHGHLTAADWAAALGCAVETVQVGRRHGDRDLVALGLCAQGRLTIYSGQVGAGLALLDEAMAGVTAGEVSPLVFGHVYRVAIEGCQEIADLGRVAEWTSALNRWWAAQVEVGELKPGTALDVGCGEGGDAVWLAEHGWRVTGLDVSQVALTRAQSAARARGVDVEWVCAALVDLHPPADRHDLVSVHYPALPQTPGDEAIHALLAAVAPGGTLLVVGHERIDPEHARAHGFDPADNVQPPDIAARLDDGWLVEVDEERPRVDPSPPGAEHVTDYVLRARRVKDLRVLRWSPATRGN